MRIDVSQLESGGQTVEEAFAGEELAGLSAGRAERWDILGASLRAWVRPEGRLVRASGEVRGQIRAECDRCLKPVTVDVASDFDQRYASQDADPARLRGVRGEGVLLGEDELDLAKLEGEVLDTAELAREQLELAGPMAVLCSETCAGLCPACRADLNAGRCGCAEAEPDPRWDALRKMMDDGR
jgi:uncharacterized protein